MWNEKRIARVFPRRTKATPDDDLCFFDDPPIMTMPEVDEVHISTTFTYDRKRAEELAFQWERLGVPVHAGGPAYDDSGDEFEPGMYIKRGYTITSRGCNNNCWFCMAQRREGRLRELEIKDGWNVLDNNLLQCSKDHIISVFKMLKKQPQKAVFTGGLEAKMLQPWHCKLLASIKPTRMYFAYDTPDDYEPLRNAAILLDDADFKPSAHVMCCYCLIGYAGDTFEAAEKRMTQAIQLGFMPYAMLYRDEEGKTNQEWRKFQREWLRPEIVSHKFGEVWNGK